MRNLKHILVFALSISFLSICAQEKKIKFSKGTLKICSAKNFQIEGYDGNEVVIKSLHNSRGSSYKTILSNQKFYSSKGNRKIVSNSFAIDSSNINATKYIFGMVDSNRKNGLKKLGKKNNNTDLGIYFVIEKKGDELIFKDNNEGQLIMMSNERYVIKIPNSIKLNWQTNSCKDEKASSYQHRFFSSKASSLSNFNGEVAISSTLNNMKLKDVTGPVSINTIGGNVTVEFDKKTPQKLYSIYSNNGFIDITLPINSNLKLDATGNDIFSDIDFKVDEEKEIRDLQHMKLKLNNGKVKMKLNANLGNIYLRKK